MRPRHRLRSAIATVALLAPLGSACAASTSTSASRPTSTGGTTTRTALGRQQAVAAADASCERHNKELPPEPTAPEEVAPFLDGALRAYRAELDDFREIRTRAGDFPELQKIIDDLEAYMNLVGQHRDELARDPRPLSDPASPYGQALARLRAQLIPLGFTICGGVGTQSPSGSSTTTTTPRAATTPGTT